MAPMRLSTALSVLSILSLSLSSCFATTDRNITLDDRDVSVVLSPIPAWALSDQANGEHGGTFSFSNAENATAVITLPREPGWLHVCAGGVDQFLSEENATAVFWQGFKRAGPALFSVCLDCTDSSQAQLIDGHDPDPRLVNTVTTIFSAVVPPDSQCNHTLIIKNLVDPRFGSPSQITIDSFIISLPSSGSMYPASAASAAPSTSIPAGTSPTTAAYWSKPSTTSTLSTGIIVGIAFAAAVALFGAVAVVWWMFRRRKVSGAMYRSIFGVDSEKQGAKMGAPESPMFNTLRTPPRNAEQASMFGVSLPPIYSDLGASKVNRQYLDRSPVSSPDSSMARSAHPPSIRSAFSSNISREPSTRSTIVSPEWGTIPVLLKNPFASPHDAEADADSDFDYDTPLPSSELGSTFTVRDERRSPSNVRSPSPIIRQVAAQPTGPAVMSTHPVWRRTEGESDGEQTPTQSRGWRRVEV